MKEILMLAILLCGSPEIDTKVKHDKCVKNVITCGYEKRIYSGYHRDTIKYIRSCMKVRDK